MPPIEKMESTSRKVLTGALTAYLASPGASADFLPLNSRMLRSLRTYGALE